MIWLILWFSFVTAAIIYLAIKLAAAKQQVEENYEERRKKRIEYFKQQYGSNTGVK